MNKPNLHLIAGRVKSLCVGTLRDHVAEKAKGLPVKPNDHSDRYQFDSERFDHFACYIGDNFVSGSFRSVRFKEGDEVSAVVDRKLDEDDLCVAVLSEDRSYLHLSMMMDRGAWARFIQPAKLLSMLFLTSSILMILLFILNSKSPKLIFEMSLATIGGSLVLVILLTLWDYYLGAGQAQGESSTAVFKLLGFRDPSWLNLQKHSLLHRHGDPLGECIYEVGELLDKT